MRESDENDVLTLQKGTANYTDIDLARSSYNDIGVDQTGLKNTAVVNLASANNNHVGVAQYGDFNTANVDLDTNGNTVKIEQNGWNNHACSSSTGSCSHTY